MASKMIVIENTRFQFATNFAGDPEKDRFGSSTRKGAIIIPDENQALELLDNGFNVKQTKPSADWLAEHSEEKYESRYYVNIIMNFNSTWPPRVYLIKENGEDVPLGSETVGMIDDIWVDNVTVVLNPYEGRNGKSLYVKSMEVYQKVDDDPISVRHNQRMAAKAQAQTDDEFIPFN